MTERLRGLPSPEDQEKLPDMSSGSDTEESGWADRPATPASPFEPKPKPDFVEDDNRKAWESGLR